MDRCKAGIPGNYNWHLLLLAFGFLLIFTNCNPAREQENDPVKQNSRKENIDQERISLSAFQEDSLGWGYDIFVDGKLYVHQPHIPVIQGMHGFKSKSEALAVGNYVAEKIENGVIPPRVSKIELDSLIDLEKYLVN